MNRFRFPDETQPQTASGKEKTNAKRKERSPAVHKASEFALKLLTEPQTVAQQPSASGLEGRFCQILQSARRFVVSLHVSSL